MRKEEVVIIVASLLSILLTYFWTIHSLGNAVLAYPLLLSLLALATLATGFAIVIQRPIIALPFLLMEFAVFTEFHVLIHFLMLSFIVVANMIANRQWKSMLVFLIAILLSLIAIPLYKWMQTVHFDGKKLILRGKWFVCDTQNYKPYTVCYSLYSPFIYAEYQNQSYYDRKLFVIDSKLYGAIMNDKYVEMFESLTLGAMHIPEAKPPEINDLAEKVKEAISPSIVSFYRVLPFEQVIGSIDDRYKEIVVSAIEDCMIPAGKESCSGQVPQQCINHNKVVKYK